LIPRSHLHPPRPRLSASRIDARGDNDMSRNAHRRPAHLDDDVPRLFRPSRRTGLKTCQRPPTPFGFSYCPFESSWCLCRGPKRQIVRAQSRATTRSAGGPYDAARECRMPRRQVNHLDGIRVKRTYGSHPAISFGREYVTSPGDSQHPGEDALPLALAATCLSANSQKLPARPTDDFDKKRRPADER
jgi:hypothetical protein